MTTDCHLANLAELHLRRPLFKGTDPQIRSSMQVLTTAPYPLCSPRRPALFPTGTDPRNQLEEIMRVLKRPSDEDLEAIMNEGTPPLMTTDDH